MAIDVHDSTAVGMMIRRHPVGTYLALTFAISWGGFLWVGGSGIITGTNWQTDPRFPAAVLLMLAGPPVAGILSTLLVSGKSGLAEMFSRLLRWQVAGRWYAVALLVAPIVQLVVLMTLSRISPEFLPSIVTTTDKASLLVPGILVGIVGGLVEELGWTGFAIPRLVGRHRILTTGVFMGLVWGHGTCRRCGGSAPRRPKPSRRDSFCHCISSPRSPH